MAPPNLPVSQAVRRELWPRIRAKVTGEAVPEPVYEPGKYVGEQCPVWVALGPLLPITLQMPRISSRARSFGMQCAIGSPF